MKLLEQLLVELDVQNIGKTLHAIQGQLEYYTKNKMEVTGVSLIPVRDMLDPKFTDEALRNNGYILTVAQFKEDAVKYLELAKKDPIIYNAVLKRLHRSYNVLISNYVKGTMGNKAVFSEITKHFAECLLACYANGAPDSKKMPEELMTRIAKMIEVEVENLNKLWYQNKMFAETQKEFTDLLTACLLEDWKAEKIDQSIAKQLQHEKSKINSVEALLTHFRDKKLPQETQDSIKTAIIAEITTEIQAGNITSNSALGSAINNIRNANLLADHYNIISQVISNWQNKQTSQETTQQLEKYVTVVLSRMKQNLESTLTQQFAQLATQIFLDKLQHGEYNKDLTENMHKYTLAFAKRILMVMHAAEASTAAKCKAAVSNEVMLQLHQSWLGGKLSAKENDFVKEIVFAFLNEIDDKIQAQVWPNKTKQGFEQLISDNAVLRGENAEIRNELSSLKAIVERQNKLLEQLAAQFKTGVSNSATALAVEEKPALPSTSLSFFGNK